MTAEEIKSIDFDLKIDNDTFVQTSIICVGTRYKVFYCFKNGDNREDGENRCSQETFTSVAQLVIDALAEPSAPTSITYYIRLTSHSNSITTYNNRDASPSAIKKIIDALTEHINEFAILTPFRRYI